MYEKNIQTPQNGFYSCLWDIVDSRLHGKWSPTMSSCHGWVVWPPPAMMRLSIILMTMITMNDSDVNCHHLIVSALNYHTAPCFVHILKYTKWGFSMYVLKMPKGGPKTCCFMQNKEVIDMCKPRVLDFYTDSCDFYVCNWLPSVQLQFKQNPKVLQLVVVQLPQEKAKRPDQTGLLNSTWSICLAPQSIHSISKLVMSSVCHLMHIQCFTTIWALHFDCHDYKSIWLVWCAHRLNFFLTLNCCQPQLIAVN